MSPILSGSTTQAGLLRKNRCFEGEQTDDTIIQLLTLSISDSIGYYDLSRTFLLMSQYVYNHTHINVSPTTPSSAPGMATSATPRRSTDTTSSSPATGVTINISSKDSTPAAPHLFPGVIAGITIGGIAFVVLPIPMGILLFRKFKKQKTNQADAQQEQETNDADGQQEPGSQAEQQPLWQRLLYRRFEMDGTARPPEMPTPDETANRSELMGDVPSPVEPRRSANRPNFEMDGGALSLSYTTTGQR